jgi:hypothetical protein
VVRRAFLERNRETSMRSFAPGSSLVAEDVYIRDTLEDDFDGSFGRGFAVEQGASAELTRFIIERAYDMGIFVNSPSTTLSATDVIVRDVDGQRRDLIGGRGINVQDGPVADLSRVRVERTRELGIAVIGDVEVTMSDILVRDTRSQESDGEWGRGLGVAESARVTVTRAVIARSLGMGVVLAEAMLQAEHLRVTGVERQECVDTTCPTRALGFGIGSYFGGEGIDVRSFVVEDAVTCGVQVAADGGIDLETGLIQKSAIGACIQVPGYELSRLQTNVVYADNDTNLDFTELPVPEVDFR